MSRQCLSLTLIMVQGEPGHQWSRPLSAAPHGIGQPHQQQHHREQVYVYQHTPETLHVSGQTQCVVLWSSLSPCHV
ncbi:hypothetical protein COO60DRAFT_1623499 [Scenedesmus sp. NREL 46B-D3]|nr:hypothetical protein COO60DRAFT_1623499 [Scenedesmus sp. NREL 46B-D3]